jgi:hypothetical protein
MFILVFTVIFGSKKGNLSVYSNFWNFKYYEFNQFFINFLNNKINFKTLNYYFLYRFQYTIITCRATIYVLFSFWIFFFSFGESLYLLIFNFSSLTDSINSNYFFIFKNHTIFFINNVSLYLSNTIMFYIIFFTSCALIFLLNIKYTFNYMYLNNLWILDFIFIILFCSLFINFYIIVVLFFSTILLKMITKNSQQYN